MRRIHRPPSDSNLALATVLRNAAAGALLGLAFAVALVALDAQGLGRLIGESDAGLTAFILLAGGFMVTFGSLVAGGAIMSIGRDDPDDSGPGTPIPVRVASRRSTTVQRGRH